MAREELEIEIDATGKVTVRTIGIKGPACLDVAEFVARIVGQIESRELTQEYYEAEVQQRAQQNIDINQRW
jgi:hypothetical protein